MNRRNFILKTLVAGAAFAAYSGKWRVGKPRVRRSFRPIKGKFISEFKCAIRPVNEEFTIVFLHPRQP